MHNINLSGLVSFNYKTAVNPTNMLRILMHIITENNLEGNLLYGKDMQKSTDMCLCNSQDARFS